MKTVTIYTDGKAGFAAFEKCPPRCSPLARQPLGDDRQAPSDKSRQKAWRGSEERYLNENCNYLYRRQSWLRRFEKMSPTRSPLARQPLGDDKQAPSDRWDRRIAGQQGAAT